MRLKHKISKKPIVWILAVLVILYLMAPCVAGVLNYPDRRGPLIYPAAYHEMLHTFGRLLVGRGATKIPLTERPWFYGLIRKPIDVKKVQDKLQNQVQEEEKQETNGATRK